MRFLGAGDPAALTDPKEPHGQANGHRRDGQVVVLVVMVGTRRVAEGKPPVGQIPPTPGHRFPGTRRLYEDT